MTISKSFKATANVMLRAKLAHKIVALHVLTTFNFTPLSMCICANTVEDYLYTNENTIDSIGLVIKRIGMTINRNSPVNTLTTKVI